MRSISLVLVFVALSVLSGCLQTPQFHGFHKPLGTLLAQTGRYRSLGANALDGSYQTAGETRFSNLPLEKGQLVIGQSLCEIPIPGTKALVTLPWPQRKCRIVSEFHSGWKVNDIFLLYLGDNEVKAMMEVVISPRWWYRPVYGLIELKVDDFGRMSLRPLIFSKELALPGTADSRIERLNKEALLGGETLFEFVRVTESKAQSVLGIVEKMMEAPSALNFGTLKNSKIYAFSNWVARRSDSVGFRSSPLDDLQRLLESERAKLQHPCGAIFVRSPQYSGGSRGITL